MDEALISTFLEARRKAQRTAIGDLRTLSVLLHYLRTTGVTPGPRSRIARSCFDQIVEDYEHFLIEQRCLAAGSGCHLRLSRQALPQAPVSRRKDSVTGVTSRRFDGLCPERKLRLRASNPPRVFIALRKYLTPCNLRASNVEIDCRKLHQTAVYLSLIVTELAQLGAISNSKIGPASRLERRGGASARFIVGAGASC